MALLLRKDCFLSRLKPLLTFQRCTYSLTEGGLHTLVESLDPIAPPNMSKWRKIDASRLRIRWRIPPSPFAVLRTLKKSGFEAYLVGGCVRDLLLNRVPKDFDIITTARLSQIKQQFHRALIVGRRFPICIVRWQGSQVEVSSFDTITKHVEEKEKHLLSCMPDDCNEKDFMRWRNSMHRDFTINSLFFDPFKNCIYDYANGMADLKSLKLRTLGPAHLSFQEDCARILRGIRIAGRLKLSIAKDTATAMHKLSPSLGRLDKGRILLELNYMLSYGAAASSISLLRRFKLLELFFPFHAAYVNQQSHERSTMLMKLLFNLDKLVTCDRPCGCLLWIGLLAFHHALVINPQDGLTIKAFASSLYHGNWNKGVKFAKENYQMRVPFVPEISGFSDYKSNKELAKEVSQLASLVQNSVAALTDAESLLKSMAKYPSSPCSGLIFVSQETGKIVVQLFNVLVDDIKSYKDGRESSEIDYALLGKRDLRETRFVLGKVILETLGVDLVQRGKEVIKPEVIEKMCDPKLSDTVKHHLLAKKDINSILFSEPKQDMVKEQKLEKINHLSQEEIATNKEEFASKDMCEEVVENNLKLMESSHLPDEELNLLHKIPEQNRQGEISDKLQDAVKDKSGKLKETSTKAKGSRPSLSSLFR